MSKFDLDVRVSGKPIMKYMADLLERNDKRQIDIDRARINVHLLKQMNNRSRLMIEAARHELNEKRFEMDSSR